MTSQNASPAPDNATVNQPLDVPKHSILNSTFPVLLPKDQALFMNDKDFEDFLKQTSKPDAPANNTGAQHATVTLRPKETDSVRANNPLKRPAESPAKNPRAHKSPFTTGLLQDPHRHMTADDLAARNQALTENADVTNVSSKDPHVDLFYDLGDNLHPERLKGLLADAWAKNAELTLKIIFNARSIHLGKSNKISAYKALGWLAENHPLTLLSNLRWLVRPVIEKKAPKADAGNRQVDNDKSKASATKESEDFDMIDADGAVTKVDAEDATVNPLHAHDVLYGCSHGYWKDLLNLVALSANNRLKHDGDPTDILNQHPDQSARGKRNRQWDPEKAKELRRQQKEKRHNNAVYKMECDKFHRALHLTVARLFATQLREDVALLASGKKAALKRLSLAAKWAPTFGEFHDKHTFILSSIAELMYPNAAEVCPDATNRELYLRHAREAVRRNVTSPLRKALSIVEREIAANQFSNINYERVPSLAMDRYTKVFLRKDHNHFSDYVKKVAEGSTRISGAVLSPSILVKKAFGLKLDNSGTTSTTMAGVKAQAEANISRTVLDGQWKSLVERIKESGKLESAIAVCDVSGSMTAPRARDGTCPMDSAIGLTLLLSEVTKPPFGGAFITFSEQPAVLACGGPSDNRGFVDKVNCIKHANWAMNTNFVKVFENLILPMAKKNKLTQEEMVKKVFVFSDMQFDHADQGGDRWTSSYQRIKQKYADEGYEMPQMVFWNLAANRTDKPVDTDDINTALVSGYSQAMLKTFMDGGGFEAIEEDMIEEEVQGETGMTKVVKKQMDPLSMVLKAVSHKAYDMLEVVD